LLARWVSLIGAIHQTAQIVQRASGAQESFIVISPFRAESVQLCDLNRLGQLISCETEPAFAFDSAGELLMMVLPEGPTEEERMNDR
jgi:hypothetical protein